MQGHICVTFLSGCLLVLGCIAAPHQNAGSFDHTGADHDNFNRNRDFGIPDNPFLGDGRHPGKRDNSFIGNHGGSDSFQDNGGTEKAQRSGKGKRPFYQAQVKKYMVQVKGRFNGKIVGNNAFNGQDNYNGYAAVHNSNSFDGNVAGDGSFNDNGNGLQPPGFYDPVGAAENHGSFDWNRVGHNSFNDNGNGLQPPDFYDPVGAAGNHGSFDWNRAGHNSFNDNGNGLQPPDFYDPVGAAGNRDSFDANRVGDNSFNDNGNGY